MPPKRASSLPDELKDAFFMQGDGIESIYTLIDSRPKNEVLDKSRAGGKPVTQITHVDISKIKASGYSGFRTWAGAVTRVREHIIGDDEILKQFIAEVTNIIGTIDKGKAFSFKRGIILQEMGKFYYWVLWMRCRVQEVFMQAVANPKSTTFPLKLSIFELENMKFMNCTWFDMYRVAMGLKTHYISVGKTPQTGELARNMAIFSDTLCNYKFQEIGGVSVPVDDMDKVSGGDMYKRIYTVGENMWLWSRHDKYEDDLSSDIVNIIAKNVFKIVLIEAILEWPNRSETCADIDKAMTAVTTNSNDMSHTFNLSAVARRDSYGVDFNGDEYKKSLMASLVILEKEINTKDLSTQRAENDGILERKRKRLILDHIASDDAQHLKNSVDRLLNDSKTKYKGMKNIQKQFTYGQQRKIVRGKTTEYNDRHNVAKIMSATIVIMERRIATIEYMMRNMKNAPLLVSSMNDVREVFKDMNKLYETFNKSEFVSKVWQPEGITYDVRRYMDVYTISKMNFRYEIDGSPVLDEGAIGLYQLALILGYTETANTVDSNTTESAYKNGKQRVMAIGSAVWKDSIDSDITNTKLHMLEIVEMLHKPTPSNSATGSSAAARFGRERIAGAPRSPVYLPEPVPYFRRVEKEEAVDFKPTESSLPESETVRVDVEGDCTGCTYVWQRMDDIEGKWMGVGDTRVPWYTATHSGTYRCVIESLEAHGESMFTAGEPVQVHVASRCARCGHRGGGRCVWSTYKADELEAWEMSRIKVDGKYMPYSITGVVAKFNGEMRTEWKEAWNAIRKIDRSVPCDFPINMDVRYDSAEDIFCVLEWILDNFKQAMKVFSKNASFIYNGASIIRKARRRFGNDAVKGLRIENMSLVVTQRDDVKQLHYDYARARADVAGIEPPIKRKWVGTCSEYSEPLEPDVGALEIGSFVAGSSDVGQEIGDLMLKEMKEARACMQRGDFKESKGRVYRAVELENILKRMQGGHISPDAAHSAVQSTGKTVVATMWKRARRIATHFLSEGQAAQRDGLYQMMFMRIV